MSWVVSTMRLKLIAKNTTGGRSSLNSLMMKARRRDLDMTGFLCRLRCKPRTGKRRGRSPQGAQHGGSTQRIQCPIDRGIRCRNAASRDGHGKPELAEGALSRGLTGALFRGGVG